MDVRVFNDAERFLWEAGPYLANDPLSASVIAGYAERVRAGGQPQAPDDLWITVTGDGHLVGLAMHTPPLRLFLARMAAPTAAPAADALANALADRHRLLPGVGGESTAVRAFAVAWRERTGQTAAVAMRMRMYRLDELVAPAEVPGESRCARPGDLKLVAAWVSAFLDETHTQPPAGDLSASCERRIDAGEVHLWLEGDAPAAMAAHSPPAAGVARVSGVYTPPAKRRHGFGAAVTAAASAAALAAGANHVVLYADLSNPSSNAIYQRIGYRPDHDAEQRDFTLTRSSG